MGSDTGRWHRHLDRASCARAITGHTPSRLGSPSTPTTPCLIFTDIYANHDTPPSAPTHHLATTQPRVANHIPS